MPNTALLRDINLQNMSDLDFNLSRSLKVKCESAIGFPIYGLLLVFNSNIVPNSASLQDIRLQIWLTLNLTFHSRSNPMVQLDSPYMTSY